MKKIMGLPSSHSVFLCGGQCGERFFAIEFHGFEIRSKFAGYFVSLVGRATKSKTSTGECGEDLRKDMRAGKAAGVAEGLAHSQTLERFNEGRGIPVRNHLASRSA